MMSKMFKPSMLACSVVLALAGCGGGGGSHGDGGVTPPPDEGLATPTACESVPESSDPMVPKITPQLCGNALAVFNDPAIQAAGEEWKTAGNAEARFVTNMEWSRIASPSHEEYNRRDRMLRDMIERWGFSPSDFSTRHDGVIEASDVNIVDGQPVYNHCVEIKGSYRDQPDAVTYQGQYPKIVFEGHIDVVNPESLAIWAATTAHGIYEPIKLQPIGETVVETPEVLAAITEELHFTQYGDLIKDDNFRKAYVRYNSAAEATAASAWRIYVPGISDMQTCSTDVMYIAKAFKDYKIKPYYDVWICGSAGEEGKGNLNGMKQLFGYDQDKGTGSNPLNVVMYINSEASLNGSNWLGSYRFEMKYSAPRTPGANPASALLAAANAIDRIGHIKSGRDAFGDTKTRTTYTVGRAYCDDPDANGVVPSCTIEVDMRSPRLGNASGDDYELLWMRSQIEPQFQKALDGAAGDLSILDGSTAGFVGENDRVNAAGGAAVTRELMWFGDRPAHTHDNYDTDPAIQVAWQAQAATGLLSIEKLTASEGSSTNTNVPAAIGIPSTGASIRGLVSSAGTHAFWEWGIPGSAESEAKQMQNALVTVLLASGFHTTDGKTLVPPAVGPMGVRTAEKQ
jgi:acetylornithine deacetylase/succinyl-diaminopimelate desuccinylase-like protein